MGTMQIGGTLKALTLAQPWASLVACGAKKIETRSWKTSYRGPLAIHAAKGFPKSAQNLFYEFPIYPALDAVKHGDLPRGSIIAIAKLVACLEITPAFVEGLTFTEKCFGDYGPGRYAWILQDATSFPEPIPAKGALSLWDWIQ